MIETQQSIYDVSRIKWGSTIDFPSTRTCEQYSHRIFNRYPARSVFWVPRAILLDLGCNSIGKRKKLKILDPFSGSGTTAIEACLHGMDPIGVELDPFARLISEVRTRFCDQRDLRILEELFQTISSEWPRVTPDQSLLPQTHNIRYWFDENTFNSILSLKTAIYRICKREKKYEDFFRIVLADIIRPCSLAERQTLKPYISRKYKKIPHEVSVTFKKSFLSTYGAITKFSQAVGVGAKSIVWAGNDARNFKMRGDCDVAITSPPYINALDYVRCIRLESAWIGTGDDSIFKALRSMHIGDMGRKDALGTILPNKTIYKIVDRLSEIDPTRARTVLSYFTDMYANLNCVYQNLKIGGDYHIIIGNSIIRGISIETHKLLAAIAESVGFKWIKYYKYRIKDHRTSMPRHGNGGKISFEHVITLRKTK